MTVPIIAAKAGTGATKALTGDIYTRRWRTKKGKKGPEVEHELRVNPVGVGLGAVAVGAAALFGAVGLWATQRKLTQTAGKDLHIIIDETFATEDTPLTFIVKTARGVPYKRFVNTPMTPDLPLTQAQRSAGYTFAEVTQRVPLPGGTRHFVRFHTDDRNTYGLGERSGFGIDIGL